MTLFTSMTPSISPQSPANRSCARPTAMLGVAMLLGLSVGVSPARADDGALPAPAPHAAPPVIQAQFTDQNTSIAERLAYRQAITIAEQTGSADPLLRFLEVFPNSVYAPDVERAINVIDPTALSSAGQDAGQDYSPELAEAQSELSRLGYYTGPFDGSPNTGTLAALEAFQRDNWLPITGEPTPETMAALRESPTPDFQPPKPPTAPQPSVAVDRPGELFQDCPQCPQMVVAPSGQFTMGSPPDEIGREPNEGPQRQVRVASFAIGLYEVTRSEYAAFADATGRSHAGGCYIWDGDWQLSASHSWRDPGFEQGGDHPALCVSWDDAQAYVAWLNEIVPGASYRLPSEAEWEYAARAGASGPWQWGAQPSDGCDVANGADETALQFYPNWNVMACADGYRQTAPAGSFAPNAFGLHDMHGNAWEWVQDCWHETYDGAPSDGTAWMSGQNGDCTAALMRGGSWFDAPQHLRFAARDVYARSDRSIDAGFRVARDIAP